MAAVPVWLLPITKNNYRTAIELCVAPEQQDFVGTVAEAIADAHFNPKCEMRIITLGGREDKQNVVGFIMWEESTLKRLLIDCRHQKKKYGTAAICLWMRMFPVGTRFSVSTLSSNTTAIALYKKVGFIMSQNGHQTIGIK